MAITAVSARRCYVVAAGGTGGHVIPAVALATELLARGHEVAMITDWRGAKIPDLALDMPIHVIPAGRIGKNPMTWVHGALTIYQGYRAAASLYQTLSPSAVIGFGGYPAYPALLAAHRQQIPTIVHEQNAVLGRVNRQLAGRVAAIATAYPKVSRLPESAQAKVRLIGNPVRAAVLALRDQPYPELDEDSIFRVLVTGGSQGASILSDVVPDGLSLLPVHFRRRMQVTQQCRPEDIGRVRETYHKLGIPADLSNYIADMPAQLAWSHVVIGRAGASTIAELTCAGRPAILVPLPSAMDNHQAFNVRQISAAGGARAIDQARFTPKELAKQMQKLGLEPEALANAAARAKSCGHPNATRDLADLVESIGTAPLMTALKVKTTIPRATARMVGAAG